MLSVADIDRWSPEAVRAVFHAAKVRAGVATTAADGLASLPAFQTWGGKGADAARDAVGKTRADLDAHGEEALAVARAADIAADGIENVKRQLNDLRAQAESAHAVIDPATNTVLPGPGFKGDATQLAPLQATLNAIIAEANAVDEELAQAIDMADGVTPIPATPPGSLSEQQIQDIAEDMIDGQDLSPAEAQQLKEQLKNQLRQASAQGLSPDQAYAKAEDFASMYTMNLHRAYVRKATRLSTLADAERTPTGDLRSDVSGAVIPAARDANGDLIWVDKNTGQRVPEGTPNSMTVPERGSYHLGHQYGEENWRVLRQAEEEGWTQQELNDFMNHHEHYRLETPPENLSHRYEDTAPYAPNPEWTPEPHPASAPLAGAPAPAPAPAQVPAPAASGSSAPMISPPPQLPPAPHPPVTLPPFLQQPVPPGYQIAPPPANLPFGGWDMPGDSGSRASAAPPGGWSMPQISMPQLTPDQELVLGGGLAALVLLGGGAVLLAPLAAVG